MTDVNDILNGQFDIATHLETFTNYLEVIILPDGTVEYAVPSHQQKLEHIIASMYHITPDQINDDMPRRYWTSVIDYYVGLSHCVSVWTRFIIGIPNTPQHDTLMSLRAAGLYLGEIPEPNDSWEFTDNPYLGVCNEV